MQRHEHSPSAGASRLALSSARPEPLAACLLAVLLIAGCGTSQEEGEPPASQSDLPQQEMVPMEGLAAADDLGPPHLLAFACGEDAPYLAILNPGGEIVMLHAPDGVHHLTLQPAASGTKYMDERHMLWTKGQEMLVLEIDGTPVEGCRPSGRQRILAAAYQAGYHLRAGGNEPGWTLSVGPHSIRLDLQHRPGAIFPGLETGEIDEDGRLVRQTQQHALEIIIENRPCRDTMSGEPAPLTVTIDLDGEVLKGCGVRLRPGPATQ